MALHEDKRQAAALERIADSLEVLVDLLKYPITVKQPATSDLSAAFSAFHDSLCPARLDAHHDCTCKDG